MNIYLIDDDPAVRSVLQLILENSGVGTVCGSADNGADALEELEDTGAELVLVDLLMPGMDGIQCVRRAKARHPELRFVMLSQVSSKDMVAEAYAAGVDFFISKPINSVEVLGVLQKMGELLNMDRTLGQMRTLLQGGGLGRPAVPAAAPHTDGGRRQTVLNGVLHRLGISGDPACREIVQVVEYLASGEVQGEQMTVAQCCAKFSDSPKAMEQRIRRAVTAGMVNLANLGLEDYANDTFTEYAGTLYHFEQVRREMDCIRGKTDRHGRASVKRFLYTLAALCRGH